MPDPKQTIAERLAAKAGPIVAASPQTVADKLKAKGADVAEGYQEAVGKSATDKRYTGEAIVDAANLAPAGALMSFDDEIAGAVSGVGHAAQGGDYQEGYAKGRAAREASKDESMRRSPIASGVGYAGGALATSAATSGLGNAVGGTAGRAISMAGGTAKAAPGAGMVGRAATAVGNAAVPGAIAGAGEARTLEDVPAEAARGAAVSTAFAAPFMLGGKAVNAPQVAGWAQKNSDKAAMRSWGMPQRVMERVAEMPGGQRDFVGRVQNHGVGVGAWPTPGKVAEQSRIATEALDAQRQYLADTAHELGARVNSADNAREIMSQGTGEFNAQVAHRGMRERVAAEAEAHSQVGTPVYETKRSYNQPEPPYRSNQPIDAEIVDTTPVQGKMVQPAGPGLPPPGGSAMSRWQPGDLAPVQGELMPEGTSPLAKYSQQGTGMVHGTPVDTKQLVRRERTIPEQSAEISAYNRRAHDAAGQKDNEGADFNRVVGRALNDTAENAINEVNPGMGTQWRDVKSDQAAVMRVNQHAQAEAAKAPVVRGMWRGGARALTGAGLGLAGTGHGAVGGVMAAAGMVGEVAANPALQYHMYNRIRDIAGAGARISDTALGRALSRMPGGAVSAGGRALNAEVHANVDRGVEEVQRAAMEDPGSTAATHFEQSETNPDYRKAVTNPEN